MANRMERFGQFRGRCDNVCCTGRAARCSRRGCFGQVRARRCSGMRRAANRRRPSDPRPNVPLPTGTIFRHGAGCDCRELARAGKRRRHSSSNMDFSWVKARRAGVFTLVSGWDMVQDSSHSGSIWQIIPQAPADRDLHVCWNVASGGLVNRRRFAGRVQFEQLDCGQQLPCRNGERDRFPP